MRPDKVATLRFALILAGLILGLILIIYLASTENGDNPSVDPITDSVVTENYPKLYKAVLSREIDRIRPFLEHDSDIIRAQAWRAMTNTPVDSTELDDYINLAIQQQDTPASWFALSHQSLTVEQLRSLESAWQNHPASRAGISTVLGQQGDRASFDFLRSQLIQAEGSEYEYEFALALGRLMNRFTADNEFLSSMVNQAFRSDDSNTIRAYLYGMYRNNIQDLSGSVRDTLYSAWRFYNMGVFNEVDQYMARILGKRVFRDLTIFYNSEKLLEENVQVSIELAQLLGEMEIDSTTLLPARILLEHTNPHVVQLALNSLDGKILEDRRIFSFIRDNLIEDPGTDPFVKVQALITLGSVNTSIPKEHSEELKKIGSENSYLLPYVLQAEQKYLSKIEYLERISQIVSEKKPLRTLFAIRSLSTFWENIKDQPEAERFDGDVRTIAFDALSIRDRGVAFTLQGLLEDDKLFSADDFGRISGILDAFKLPEDIEVYQAFGSLFKDKFEEQASALIDSLARLGYTPLNRSLADAGWDVTIPEESDTEFRTPRWQRVWKLGYHPVLVLQTQKGDIRVQLNTLEAPTTIAAVDSLLRSGAYNGVPIHRVVPNFVIQGGDIERADGFGGPDFIIPTEASEKEFNRGAIGIASAGTDTEGSQYFIMHQWKPHLNGNYTRFGEVIEGMRVVDRIVVGDTVETVYWQ